MLTKFEILFPELETDDPQGVGEFIRIEEAGEIVTDHIDKIFAGDLSKGLSTHAVAAAVSGADEVDVFNEMFGGADPEEPEAGARKLAKAVGEGASVLVRNLAGDAVEVFEAREKVWKGKRYLLGFAWDKDGEYSVCVPR